LYPWNLSQVSRGSLCISFAFLAFGVWSAVSNRPNRFWKPIWPVLVEPAWPVMGTGLTGLCLELALDQGELAYVQGELLCALVVCALCLSMVFVSDVSSRCPCLKGPRLVFFKWSCLLPFSAFDRLMEFLFSFCFFSIFLFSLFTKCVCCQCTHQGGDWGPCLVRGPMDGRLLVWWVIDNVVWTDSWLSIAGAGCGLTRVGAGEEQAWKVVAGEASRCGENK
jgi:hypothetical protein